MLEFDQVTLERGQSYFLEDRVVYIDREGSVVVAMVQGSGENVYSVYVDLDAPDVSYCSCPLGFGCKHVVATVLTVLGGHLDDGDAQRRLIRHVDVSLLERVASVGPSDVDLPDPVDDYDPSFDSSTDLLFDEPRTAEESVVDVEEALAGVRPSSLERVGRDSSPRLTEREDETDWRFVLLVGAVYGDVPSIYPARQYRRKDGAYGRVDGLRRGEAVFVPNADVRRLASRILCLHQNVPLVLFAEELEKVDVPIFHGTTARTSGVQRAPVAVLRPDRLRVEAIPRARKTGRVDQIEIGFEVYAQKGDVESGVSGRVLSDAGAGASVLLSAGGTLLIDSEDSPLPLLGRLLDGHGGGAIEDVEAFRRLAKRFPNRLEFSFPKQIRVIPVEPTAVFQLYGDRYLSTAVLSFHAVGVEDGYSEDEYRLHAVAEGRAREPTGAATEIFGERPVHRSRNRRWEWYFKSPRVDLLEAGMALLEKGYQVYVPNGTKMAALGKATTPVVRITSGIDWFGLHVQLNGQDVDFPQLQRMAARGFYEAGGVLRVLDPTEAERLRLILDAMDAQDSGRIRRQDIATVAGVAELADAVDADAQAITDLARSILNPPERRSAETPNALSAVLRAYQVEGFRWLASLADHDLSGCLADDMGLGKTVQALAFMLHLVERSRRTYSELQPGGFLVIAPVSTLQNWRREAERFAPTLRCLVHHGPDRSGGIEALISADLVVTSYATALRDREILAAARWQLICLDEAQFIKNPYAATTKRIKSLEADLRLCLTGTPVENMTTDLWSIMDFLVPGLLGSLGSFTSRFPKRGGNDPERTATRLARLKRIVSPFLLRRTKEAVAPELPPKTETVRTCEMGRRQAAFYETLRVYHRIRVQDAIASGRIEEIGAAVFTGLLRLRQAAIYPQDADPEGEGVPSVKEAELLDQLQEVAAEGNKALVFSQFVSSLQRLESRARENGLSTLYLDGSTKRRDELIDRFQAADEPLTFFISLRAGGTGINLTAADYVFICDPWWNPQVERQAVDRAHRIGRSRPVMVSRLVTAGTVEEKVLSLQEQKRRLAGDLIAENQNGLSLASAEELLALFD